MKTMIKNSLILLLFICQGQFLPAQDTRRELDAALASFVKLDKFNGSALVARKGRLNGDSEQDDPLPGRKTDECAKDQIRYRAIRTLVVL